MCVLEDEVTAIIVELKIRRCGATDEFDLTIVLEANDEKLVGVAKLNRRDQERLYEYFCNYHRGIVVIAGPLMHFVVDASSPMPAFRLLPTPAGVR